MGIDEGYVALERDAWIMIAAQMPDQINKVIADKHAALDDPEVANLYHLLSDAMNWSVDDQRVVELADCIEALMVRSEEAGGSADLGLDSQFIDLLDASAVHSSPVAKRLRSILEDRGWNGWIRGERNSRSPQVPATPSTQSRRTETDRTDSTQRLPGR